LKIAELNDQRNLFDCVVLPFIQGEKASQAYKGNDWETEIQSILQLGDFKGKLEETEWIYFSATKEKRILLIGLGKEEDLTLEVVRLAYAKAIKAARVKKLNSVSLMFPDLGKLEDVLIVEAITQGSTLANYDFSEYKKQECPAIEKIQILGADTSFQSNIDRMMTICEGVYFTRTLVNKNADEISPQTLGSFAKDSEKLSSKLKVEVHDKKWIEKQKMGLLLAVGRGSMQDPVFIEMHYEGDPDSKECIAFVGKGITYDTGGLSLKPPPSMLDMKSDMSGAAAVIGAMRVIAKLGLKVNLKVFVPATENAIGPRSYKVGDVYRSYLGKTVQIINTDAEGRLILADALSYAATNYKPKHLFDVASLTGAIVVALGEEVTGLFCNDEKLCSIVTKAGEKTGETVCNVPLVPSYKKLLDSQIADLANCGNRNASSITAALFLEAFVEKVSWAHLDIAGTSFISKPYGYYPISGTGVGVQLLVETIEKIIKQ